LLLTRPTFIARLHSLASHPWLTLYVATLSQAWMTLSPHVTDQVGLCGPILLGATCLAVLRAFLMFMACGRQYSVPLRCCRQDVLLFCCVDCVAPTQALLVLTWRCTLCSACRLIPAGQAYLSEPAHRVSPGSCDHLQSRVVFRLETVQGCELDRLLACSPA
jgi:hypothetical protein